MVELAVVCVYKGTPVSELIDGVLADSGGYTRYPNISTTRLEALEDSKFQMMGELQKIMSAANGGIVMANGLSMYGPPNADPRSPDDHNLKVLSHVDAVMNEHTAVFEVRSARWRPRARTRVLPRVMTALVVMLVCERSKCLVERGDHEQGFGCTRICRTC